MFCARKTVQLSRSSGQRQNPMVPKLEYFDHAGRVGFFPKPTLSARMQPLCALILWMAPFTPSF